MLSYVDARLIDEELKDQETQALLQQMQRVQEEEQALEVRRREAAKKIMMVGGECTASALEKCVSSYG